MAAVSPATMSCNAKRPLGLRTRQISSKSLCLFPMFSLGHGHELLPQGLRPFATRIAGLVPP